jgi:hypothetical protein
MKYYIQEYNNSLSFEICQNVINKFENEKLKTPGRTINGININIKNTMDYTLDIRTETDEQWLNIEKILYDELQSKIQEYVKIVNITYNYELFKPNTIITDNGFLIQKYKKNEGKYEYHVDSLIEWANFKNRVITFIWYLNDLTEGGETEFW